MTKQIAISPDEQRRSGVLNLGSVPVNAYDTTIADELASNDAITPTSLIRMYRDMVIIRTFETMLDDIKKLGSFEGIAYQHAGPAHLSIGQEGAAVGECFHLGVEDHIFGSHRSHGEIIAKGLRAVQDLAGSDLQAVMESYFGGDILRVVERAGGDAPALAIDQVFATSEEEEQGINFLLYGLLAEVFGRETGFNRGMGGSMHAFFTPFGVFPNNAIVGGSGPVATGSALFKKVQRAAGITVANIGDASLGCGPVLEGLGFASMEQYDALWGEAFTGGLPIIFNIMNNFYGMGGQPFGETSGLDRLARLGAAFNADGMHAECVDGNNPLSLADAYRRKKDLITTAGGPIFLEVVCYRQSGHSPSDQSSYRDREEMDAWRAQDPIVEFGDQLTEAGVAAADQLNLIHTYATSKVREALRRAADVEVSPRMVITSDTGLESIMFSEQTKEELPGLSHEDDVLMPMGDNPRVQQIAKKSRAGIDASGTVLKEAKAVSFRDGLFETIIHHMYNDSRVVAYGEENRDWGGAFAVYRGLTEALPYHRLFNSPISEAAIVGTAVGYALEGGVPLVELMYCDFLGRAGDEVFNQMPKWQAMSGGYCTLPMVLRVSVGSKYGAQHSQDWTALCAHVPGLKVAFPATPYAAKGLMATALSGSDPVVFFESQRTYDQTEIFREGGVPAEYYRLPFGEPQVIKEGRDLTILTFGATLYRAWEAAQEFEKTHGISVELIDGCTLVPFGYDMLIESVKKTGRLMLASDACQRGSFLHTVASRVTQEAFDYLDAPVAVMGARDWIVPPAEMEEDYYPQASWFLDAYHNQIQPLPGHTSASDRA
jgi:2-oxoisovalerate dehydrogenase E1 component